MKKLLLILILLGIASFAIAGDDWFTDFEETKAEAVERNLPILVNFSGSDWCRWCVKLDNEVFSKYSFKKYAKKNLVLFLADFPRKESLPDDLKKQNDALLKKYGVRGYPTVLLLRADGEVIARTSYKAGGADLYVEHLKKLLK